MNTDSSKEHKSGRRRFYAVCGRGLEDLLARELGEAGVERIRPGVGGVRFEGDLRAGYLACLWSRTVSRVLVQLGEVDAATAEQLHAGVMDIPWELHIPADSTLAVDFSGVSDSVRNTLFGARKVKDGIVDRLRAVRGERPSVDLQAPGVRLTAHLQHDRLALGIDLSGPAHRRGYRGGTGAAPLRENLAAAVLLRAGWPGIAAAGGALYDPLCGSGTLLVEGAMIAADAAPGEVRERGSPRWMQHEDVLWSRLVIEARGRRERGSGGLPPIEGADADGRVLAHAAVAAESAGYAGLLRFRQLGLEDQHRPPAMADRQGLLVCNPPWGERLGTDVRLQGLYAELGRLAREEFAGWRVAVLTVEGSLGGALDLRIDRDYRLRNGPIDCRLLLHDPDARSGRSRTGNAAHPRMATGPDPRVTPPEAVDTAGAAADSAGVAMLANRLRKNLRRLRSWLAMEKPECYRVYDADIPEYAVAVDRYGEWLHVAEYAPPATVDAARAQARLVDVRAALGEVFGAGAERIVLKTRTRQRGARQYERLGREQRFTEVREGPARLLVNLHDYLDTGLFLDHRPARRLVARLAPGRRFLNLFCYTATASVLAAHGGARTTTSIDMSSTYLDWAERNLALNGFGAPDHRCLRADCLAWLAEAQGEWDLIFLDPPSFSNSARMSGTLDIQRDHAGLVKSAARLLAPGGVLLFSTNRKGFRLDRDALSEWVVEDLSESSVDPDFPRRPLPHRLYRIQHGS